MAETMEPPVKKAKVEMEQAPDCQWPEAWVMPDGECKDQKAANKQDPNAPVTAADLKNIGIW